METKNKICRHPFETIQIQNTGNVFCCCCYWTNFYSFGNIYEQSFDEIWNGEKAQEFRKQFLENNFKYCNFDECEMYQAKDDYKAELVCDYPKQIEFSYDRHCNIRCVFCRRTPTKFEVQFNQLKEKKLEKNFDKIFPPILEKAKVIELNSAGELFASRHSLEILKKSIRINPSIKFKIISNGILFTKEKIEELGLKERMQNVTISLHSTTEETYNKLIERGNFKAVIENLEYLSELKKQDFLGSLQINFVVTSVNYKEMKDFVLLAKRLGARAFFIKYHRQYDAGKLEKIWDISQPEHKDYNKLVKILQDPIFKEDFCVLSEQLKHLEPKKNFFQKLFNK